MSLTDQDKQFIEQRTLEIAQQLHASLTHKIDQLNGDLWNQLADLRHMLIEDRAPKHHVTLESEHKVALTSNDHIAPWGTKQDNTRSARFVHACEAHFKRPLRGLDLGCSGGGVVFDFLVRGHLAFGLEGSDFSLKAQRAEWRTIGDYLFTCDISKPFKLIDLDSGKLQQFDVISMWEVLEHIEAIDLMHLFANVKSHLAPDGIFVGSIGLLPDIVNGVNYHRTVESPDWWRLCFQSNGLAMVENTIFGFYDFCRGCGNGPMDPDFSKRPDMGFHFVARHSPRFLKGQT
jgi:SAM-dependent methyltransferase